MSLQPDFPAPCPYATAVGDNVVIFLDGLPTTTGDTSASAPVFGAILNRINEERFAAEKKMAGDCHRTNHAGNANTDCFHKRPNDMQNFTLMKFMIIIPKLNE